MGNFQYSDGVRGETGAVVRAHVEVGMRLGKLSILGWSETGAVLNAWWWRDETVNISVGVVAVLNTWGGGGLEVRLEQLSILWCG